jgi:hypothetical protein
MAIMAGGVGLFISDCSPTDAILSAPQFHDIMLVAGFIRGVFCGFMDGWFCMGLGCVKFGSGCRHFRASSVILLGR